VTSWEAISEKPFGVNLYGNIEGETAKSLLGCKGKLGSPLESGSDP